MMNIKIIKLYLVFFVAFEMHAVGQIYTDKHSRPLLPGARAAAMADALTGDISEVSTLYGNPASLPFVEKQALLLDHFYEWTSAVATEVLAAPLHATEHHAVGLGAHVSHVGYLRRSRPYPASMIQYGMDGAYANVLSSGFSVGVRFGLRYTQNDHSAILTNSWSIGVTYYPSPDISYGVVYNAFGDAALAVNDSTLATRASPRRLQIGITMRYPSSFKRRLLTLALTNEKVFGETGLYYRFGVEVLPIGFLAARLGYFVGPTTAAVRYGAGIRTDYVEVDYAISPRQGLRFQEVSLLILLK